MALLLLAAFLGPSFHQPSFQLFSNKLVHPPILVNQPMFLGIYSSITIISGSFFLFFRFRLREERRLGAGAFALTLGFNRSILVARLAL